MRYEKIIRNSARCLLCGDEVESECGHDFQPCSCRNLAVDGGKEYLRRVYGKGDTWVETSIVEVIQPADWNAMLADAIEDGGIRAEIARIIVQRGFSLDEASRRMGLSPDTADWILRDLRRPLDDDDRSRAMLVRLRQ